jgi:hypothetical protein
MCLISSMLNMLTELVMQKGLLFKSLNVYICIEYIIMHFNAKNVT